MVGDDGGYSHTLPTGLFCGQERGSTSLDPFQREQREGGAGVGEVVVAVGVERTREPAARFALVRPEPGHATRDGFLCGGHPGLAQEIDNETGCVAVTGAIYVVRGSIQSVPGPQRRQIPAAVVTLQG